MSIPLSPGGDSRWHQDDSGPTERRIARSDHRLRLRCEDSEREHAVNETQSRLAPHLRRGVDNHGVLRAPRHAGDVTVHRATMRRFRHPLAGLSVSMGRRYRLMNEH